MWDEVRALVRLSCSLGTHPISSNLRSSGSVPATLLPTRSSSLFTYFYTEPQLLVAAFYVGRGPRTCRAALLSWYASHLLVAHPSKPSFSIYSVPSFPVTINVNFVHGLLLMLPANPVAKILARIPAPQYSASALASQPATLSVGSESLNARGTFIWSAAVANPVYRAISGTTNPAAQTYLPWGSSGPRVGISCNTQGQSLSDLSCIPTPTSGLPQCIESCRPRVLILDCVIGIVRL
ncbi:hypothetical protein K438DRAFT_1807441, partial [Mycena galopus ATCC 62051]